MPLAYKYVALSLMLLEASLNSHQLGLPLGEHWATRDVSFAYISPTNTLRFGGYLGRVDLSGYAFSWGGRRNFRYITRIHPFGDLPTEKENEFLSGQKSVINSNGAYRLATNWLRMIQVDVLELQRTNKVSLEQRWYWGPGNRRVLLPVFYVTWGDSQVKVTVDGRTKSFTEIRLENDSFTQRPRELIRNVGELVAISDSEFLNYSLVQRSNLVLRFAATNYENYDFLGEVPVSPRHAKQSQRRSPEP